MDKSHADEQNTMETDGEKYCVSTSCVVGSTGRVDASLCQFTGKQEATICYSSARRLRARGAFF